MRVSNAIVSVSRLKKAFYVSFFCLAALTFCKYILYSGIPDQFEEENGVKHNELMELVGDNNLLGLDSSVQDYYGKRKHWVTSNLGSILFKNDVQRRKSKNRTFVILMWKYWGWLKTRHLGSHDGGDPFDDCSVNNCIVTGDDAEISTADAVVVHVQHGTLPSTEGRKPTQRWVFLSDESPVNSFSLATKKPNVSQWANVFNWSMTYRSDSDVPVPYGRTVPLITRTFGADKMQESLLSRIPSWEKKENQKTASVAALISHCIPKRMNYIKELQKYIEVDVYGKCSEKNLTCPGHFRNDCPILNKYSFYLAFENTKCRQYLTEKIFYNAYAKGAIPIIMGAPKEDCDNLLPPHSFLHVDNYKNPKALAEDIIRIITNHNAFLTYHQWRRHFELLNEHGFFGTKSYHLCRVCEALNFNKETPKVYGHDDLKLFFEPKLICNLPDRR